jgi:hypothetical protein
MVNGGYPHLLISQRYQQLCRHRVPRIKSQRTHLGDSEEGGIESKGSNGEEAGMAYRAAEGVGRMVQVDLTDGASGSNGILAVF